MPKTKQEAADFLGVKPRTLELYTQRGRLSVAYVKGTRGNIAQYKDEELEKLKQELEQETVYPARGALVAKPDAGIAKIEPSAIASLVESIAAAVRSQSAPLSVAIENKPLLTLKECSALTGLSRDYLSDAIHAGNLKARIIGKGYKIKRSDLDNFIEKL